jgi:carbon storage regulator
MLVFTRKRGESIVIGDGIEVRVLRVGHDGVRLGIVAPHDVPIHRREVYDAIHAANKSAAASDAAAARRVAAALRRSQGPAPDPDVS